MHNHMYKMVMVMFMVALCGQFYLKGVYCNWVAIQTPFDLSMNFKCIWMHECSFEIVDQVWCCNGELMSLMCGWNQLKEVCCKVICKINSNLNLN